MHNKIDGRHLDHATNEFIRKNAVRRYLSGESASAIMSGYGYCETTIYKWISIYESKGENGLNAKPIPGREPKLDDDQIEIIRKMIIGGDPRQLGLDLGLWTRQIISDFILKKFKISIGLTAVGRMLHRIGIVPVKPLRRAYERDPQAIEHWKNKEYQEIRKRAEKYGADIYFLDECGVRSDSVLGKTWGQRGKRTVVPTSGKRQSINAISAVNESGAFWFNVYSGKMNKELFIDQLKLLIKGRRRPLYLVVDSHPAHRAKQVTEFIQEQKGRLEMYFLPGYAPEINPDEYVWNYLKSEGPSKRPMKIGESLMERVTNILQYMKEMPDLIRNLFKAPELDYL
jgi:transposase